MIEQAEQSLLASMINNPGCLIDVLELITHEDFASDRHRRIARSIIDLNNDGAVDLIAVSEATGDFDYIVDLTSNTHQYNPVISATIVERESFRRKALCKLEQATKDVIASQSMDDCLKAVSDALRGLEVKVKCEESWQDSLRSAIDRLDSRMKGEAPQGLMTGFNAVDDRLNGIKDGNLRIVAARPGMGKTTLVLNEAIDIASRGGNVLFFSLEMSREELVDRAISSISGIKNRNILRGQLDDDDHAKLLLGMQKLKGIDLHIIDQGGIDIRHAANIAKKFHRVRPLDAIYFDYLQLIRFKSATRFDEVSEVSRQLKELAKSLGAPITALSQLSRNVESRPDKRPINADLRESGQIEQDADIIQFIYRDDYYNKDSDYPGIAEIITSKFRNGEAGTDYLLSELQYTRFSNLNYVPQPKEREPEYKPYGKK